MATGKKGYSRPNFFEGLIVKEDDLNDILRYTVDKHRIYNQHFHSPGVVAGVLGELRVTARERGDLSFEISGGYAIDGQGMPRRAGSDGAQRTALWSARNRLCLRQLRLALPGERGNRGGGLAGSGAAPGADAGVRSRVDAGTPEPAALAQGKGPGAGAGAVPGPGQPHRRHGHRRRAQSAAAVQAPVDDRRSRPGAWPCGVGPAHRYHQGRQSPLALLRRQSSLGISPPRLIRREAGDCPLIRLD